MPTSLRRDQLIAMPSPIHSADVVLALVVLLVTTGALTGTQQQGDRLRISVAGTDDRIEGTINAVSTTNLTLLVNAHEREVPLDSIEEVWRFHEIPAWPVLAGFGTLGTATMLIRYDEVEERMSRGVAVLFGAAFGTALGAILYYVVPVDWGFWKRVELTASPDAMGLRASVLLTLP